MKHSLLFVDDETSILKAVRRLFRDAPYDVRTAENAAAALRMLEEAPADLIVSDYRMPGIDGVTFLQTVSERYPDTIRILLTGFADVGVAQEAINEAHVFRFLTKPWVDTELQNVVQLGIYELDSRRAEFAEADAEREVNQLLKAQLEQLAVKVKEQEGVAVAHGKMLKAQLAATSRGLLSALLAKQPRLGQRLQRNAYAASKLLVASGESWLVDYVIAAGWLHEIGVLVQPPAENGRAQNLRYEQDHCQIGSRILQSANYPSLIVEAVLYHHENWNGSGPWGLHGLQIPLLARILRAVDFLTEYLAGYKEGDVLPDGALIAVIDGALGRQIDPRIGGMMIHEIQQKGARALFPSATPQLPEFESLSLLTPMERSHEKASLNR